MVKEAVKSLICQKIKVGGKVLTHIPKWEPAFPQIKTLYFEMHWVKNFSKVFNFPQSQANFQSSKHFVKTLIKGLNAHSSLKSWLALIH